MRTRRIPFSNTFYLYFLIRCNAIKLFFEDETLEISHQATDRSIFAKGAIIAGKWLKDKPPGLYTMQDIYS